MKCQIFDYHDSYDWPVALVKRCISQGGNFDTHFKHYVSYQLAKHT